MAPSSHIELTPCHRARLLGIAREAIGGALRGVPAPQIEALEAHPALGASRAVFVTLTQARQLRGCIGTLEPVAPLARAVAEYAVGAALHDPRFARLQAQELARTGIEIAVLGSMEPLVADSRDTLLAQLEPAVDGLMLEDRSHRATFLPKVWVQLPDPAHFLEQLLAKAGLPADHWSPTLRFNRYRTVTFADTA
ncbi:MAG: AmmeMemoRadiSam system protein A [Halioglobus sp.]|nr:AmmeMemoRadiSam system protein A [Halioglobus sp.]